MGSTIPGSPPADFLPLEPALPSFLLFSAMDAGVRGAFVGELEWFTLPGGVTLKSAGPIEYYCRFHPNMIGHISAAKE